MDKPPASDDQLPLSPSSLTMSETHQPGALSRDPRDAEIRALRERLAFYESFDALIRDNVSRAGDLLRQAASRQVDAELELRKNERRQVEERGNYRRVFSGLLDEVSTVQGQVERLARQVADALDDLESQLPAAGELAAIERGELPSIPGMSGGAPADIISEEAAPPTPAVVASEEDEGDELAFEEYVDDALAEDIAFSDRSPFGEDELADALLDADEDDHSATMAIGMIGVMEPSPEPSGSGGDDVLLAEHVPSPVSDVAAAATAAAYPSGAVADAGPELAAVTDSDAATRDVMTDQATLQAEPSAVDADDMERVVPDGSQEPSREDAFHEAAMEHVAPNEIVRPDELREPEALAEAGQTDSLEAATVADEQVDGGGAASAAFDQRWDGVSGQEAGSDSDGDRMTDERSALVVDDRSASEVEGAEEPLDTVLLVHGVPRATTALSLKRYLEGLSTVRGVEPREYAEGVLRLHVSSERPIRLEDLTGWPDGTGLEAVTARDDLLEVRLPR